MGLDATKGGAQANSYATVADADAILEMVYGCEEWMTLDDAIKEKLLVTATIVIDELPIRYGKLDETQELPFPLLNVGDDGFTNVVKACIWQAWYILENQDTIREGMAGSILGTKTEALAPKLQKATSGFNQFRKWSPKTLKLLVDYCDFSTRTARG